MAGPLLTREEFFSSAHGLAPVSLATIKALNIEDCAICRTDELDLPVRTPCNHIFCEGCIKQWLGQAGKNTCPSCRSVLFALPLEEPIVPAADRRALVNQAVRRAGLAIDVPGEIDPFGIAVTARTADVAGLQRAIPSAAQYMVFNPEPNVFREAGPALLSYERMRAHIIAIGNLVPAVAALQNRPFSQREKADWHIILSRLKVVLWKKDHQQFDAMTMPRQLRTDLLEHMVKFGYAVLRCCSFRKVANTKMISTSSCAT